MKEYMEKVVAGEDLTREEAAAAMECMLTGQASQAQIAGFLTALRMKGETLEEITGCASVLKDKAEHIRPKVENYVDLVGTGGDGTFTFNISTTSAFVCAAAGLAVAKHGNRSISSKSGAGDVLEALGVNIMADPKLVESCVEKHGIGFMFAQTFNKSMKYVGQARKEMGIRTIFNILGPLANPSGAPNMVVGVYDRKLTEVVAQVLGELGVQQALVVSGKDHMDEITLTTETVVSELRNGAVRTYEIAPEEFGLKRAAMEELRGGDGAENAAITRGILSGSITGAKRDIVLLNAGATLYISGMAATLEEGMELAKEAIDSRRAEKVLNDLIVSSNETEKIA